MHSARSTTNCFSYFIAFAALFVFTQTASAQENSPYSRYGLGDWMNNANTVNRGMGGFGAAYSDYGIVGSPFNVNLQNPAALGFLSNTKNFSNAIFDLGGEISSRLLTSNTSFEKYRSNNANISYFQLALPVSTVKMEKKGMTWAWSLGIRPVSRINYKIEQNGRVSNVDSINTVYEGNGGMQKANIATGFKIVGRGKMKNELSVGLNTGYCFGTKSTGTRTNFINDSVAYFKSNYEADSRFGGLFLDAGVQYAVHFKSGSTLRLGAYFNATQSMRANQNTINETYSRDANGVNYTIDSVYTTNDVAGRIQMPQTICGGFSYQSANKRWLIGADYETSNWSAYRFYDKPDLTADNYTIKAGVEYYPIRANASTNKYWNYIKFRTGFYYGTDYIKVRETVKQYALTFGASMPLTTPRLIQSRGDYVALHTSLEVGNRGDKNTFSLKENMLRLNFGISMNARWFQKRSYE
jgi:hypothetical protein